MDESKLSEETSESNESTSELQAELDERAEASGEARRPRESTVEPGLRAKGSVKGRVEKLTVHEFTLFPPIGESSITCNFKESLFESVKRAITRNVLVHGTLYYAEGKAYPERIQVDDLEALPPDTELPSLGSLRGIMPNATNGKKVMEFLQGIRDE